MLIRVSILLVPSLQAITTLLPKVFVREEQDREVYLMPHFFQPKLFPFTMLCNTTASSSSLTDIYWTRFGRVVQNSIFYRISSNVTETNLTVLRSERRFGDKLYGDYQCVINTKIGIFSSRYLIIPDQTLSIDFLQSSRIHFKHNITEGQPSYVDCAAVYYAVHLPRIITLWDILRRRGPLPMSVIGLEDARVYFPEPKIEDSNTYRCRFLTDSHYLLSDHHGYLDVTVVPSTENIQFPLSLWQLPESQIGVLGKNATFFCLPGGMGARSTVVQWSYPRNSNPIIQRGSLTVIVSPNSTGTYTCSLGTQSKSVQLSILDTPALITSLPPFVFVPPRSKTVLTCSTSAAEPLVWKWYFNGRILPFTSLTRQITRVTIQNVTEPRIGIYQCSIENPAGYNMSTTSLQYLGDLPEVNIDVSNDNYIYKEGANVTIRCLTTTTIVYSIQWKKDDKFITRNAMYQINTTSERSTLTIVSFGLTMAGNYSCIVHGKSEILSSRSVMIQQAILEIRYHSTRFDRPTLYSYTKNVPVFSDCAIEIKSFPKARVQWAVAISSTRTKPLNLTVTMVDDNGRLLFRYPNRKDNGIIYRCSYSNEYITSPNYGFITARFSEPSSNSLEVPYTLTAPKSQSAIVGQSIIFNCVSFGRGSLERTIHWIYPSNVIPDHITSNELHITVRPGYNGKYTCIAGILSHSATLTIIDPPVLISTLSNLSVQYNADLTLSCNIISSSPAIWEWYFNGKKLSTHTKMSVLIIKNVTWQNVGVYQCIVTNPAGSVRSAAYIQLIAREPFITSRVVEFFIVFGKKFTHSCNGSGHPPLTYSWEKISGDKANYSHNQGILSISKSTYKHTGRYECKVSNNIGGTKLVDRQTWEIVVIEPTVIVQKRQNRLEVKVGTLVDFPCFVTHSKLSSVSFQWKRNNVIIVSDNNTQFISGDQGVTLIIESTSHSNDGVYQCIVSTFSSEAVLAPEVAYTTTELIVTDGPILPNIIQLKWTFINTLHIMWSYYGDIKNYLTYSLQWRKDDTVMWNSFLSSDLNQTDYKVIGNYSFIELGADYYVRVALFNENGQMRISSVETFTTLSVPSGPPRDVKAMRSNKSIVISWKPPSDPNGLIVNYTIVATDILMDNRMITVLGNITTYTLTGVLDNKRYLIEVAAATAAGYGPFSAQVSVPSVPSVTRSYTPTPKASLKVLMMLFIMVIFNCMH